MLEALLKCIELLLSQLHTAPDKKRAKLAKELLQIYLDLCEIVRRGRTILSLYERKPSEPEEAILLLTQQLRALDRLKDHLSEEAVTNTIQLHLPDLVGAMGFALEKKSMRVWMGLDLLVSGGESIAPDEWIARLESRMPEHDPDDPHGRFSLQHSRVLPFAAFESSTDRIELRDVTLIGSQEEITRGHVVLDGLEKVGMDLRAFLLEKFRLEDVL